MSTLDIEILKKHFSEKRALFEKSEHFRDFVAFFHQILASLNIIAEFLVENPTKLHRSSRFFLKSARFFSKVLAFSKSARFFKMYSRY